MNKSAAVLKKNRSHQLYLYQKLNELDARGGKFSEHRLERLSKFNNAIFSELVSHISVVEK